MRLSFLLRPLVLLFGHPFSLALTRPFNGGCTCRTTFLRFSLVPSMRRSQVAGTARVHGVLFDRFALLPKCVRRTNKQVQHGTRFQKPNIQIASQMRLVREEHHECHQYVFTGEDHDSHHHTTRSCPSIKQHAEAIAHSQRPISLTFVLKQRNSPHLP